MSHALRLELQVDVKAPAACHLAGDQTCFVSGRSAHALNHSVTSPAPSPPQHCFLLLLAFCFYHIIPSTTYYSCLLRSPTFAFIIFVLLFV